MWPNDRFIEMCGIELPIIHAPMAGAAMSEMVIAVSEAGGLGSLPCALLSLEQAARNLKSFGKGPRNPSTQTSSASNRPRDDRDRQISWRRPFAG